MGLFLVANKLGFDKLINVDIDKDTLTTGAKLLDKLGISDKVEHMNKDANTIDYRQLSHLD